MKILKQLLDKLASLSKPATLTAVAAVILEVVQSVGVHIDGQVVAGILTGIGAIAAFVEQFLPADKTPAKPVSKTPAKPR